MKNAFGSSDPILIFGSSNPILNVMNNILDRLPVILGTIAIVLILFLALMIALNSGKAKRFNKEGYLWSSCRYMGPIPIPWHQYILYKDKLITLSGLVHFTENECYNYLILDITMTQNLLERMVGGGTIKLSTRDLSDRYLYLRGIKNPHEVKELISEYSVANRRQEVFIRE